MAENTTKIIVEIPGYTGDSRYKMWAKTLTGIDSAQSNGYAYQGAWLTLGRKAELAVGSYVLLYGERGSRARHAPYVTIARVTADGGLETVLSAESDRSWALTLRDQAAALFAAPMDRAALEAEATALRARLAEIETLLETATN